MDTITRVRLPNGTEMYLEDWVDRPIFSTIDTLTSWTDQVIAFFTYAAGEQVPGTNNATAFRTATERDTNIAVAGGNVSTEEMLVYALKPEYFELQTNASTPTDLSSASIRLAGQPIIRPSILGVLFLITNLRLKISQKAYAEGGTGYFPTGFGVSYSGQGAQNTAVATPRGYATSGVPQGTAVKAFAVPHHIGGTEKYQAELRNYFGATVQYFDENVVEVPRCVVQIRLYLDGMRKRPTA